MKNAERLYAEAEPTLETIAMMAAEIYARGDIGIGAAVKRAFQIWDETVAQVKPRLERSKANAQLV